MILPSISKYPSTIIVNKEMYRVRFVKRIHGKDSVGECDPESKTIRIKREQSAYEIFSTFIHEVLHAIEFEYEIDLKHKHVYALERALGDVFLKNF